MFGNYSKAPHQTELVYILSCQNNTQFTHLIIFVGFAFIVSNRNNQWIVDQRCSVQVYYLYIYTGPGMRDSFQDHLWAKLSDNFRMSLHTHHHSLCKLPILFLVGAYICSLQAKNHMPSGPQQAKTNGMNYNLVHSNHRLEEHTMFHIQILLDIGLKAYHFHQIQVKSLSECFKLLLEFHLWEDHFLLFHPFSVDPCCQ